MGTVALGSSAGRWIMISAILASAMAFIDSSALNVVLPALQKDLHASGTDLFWVLNAYLLMLASLVLIGGALGDKLGRKKIFMVGIFVFMIGSARLASLMKKRERPLEPGLHSRRSSLWADQYWVGP